MSEACRGNGADGTYPNPLTQGTDGQLYGTTQRGGTDSSGTIFRITSEYLGFNYLGSITGIRPDSSLPAQYDGSRAALVAGGNGLLFGTTYVGRRRSVR